MKLKLLIFETWLISSLVLLTNVLAKLFYPPNWFNKEETFKKMFEHRKMIHGVIIAYLYHKYRKPVIESKAPAELNLWLDDLRDPKLYLYENYIWVKTAQEAIDLLGKHEFTNVSLDHDLGDDEKHGTGYQVVCWMEENNKWPKNRVRVHSANPVGSKRMRQVINKYYDEQRAKVQA